MTECRQTPARVLPALGALSVLVALAVAASACGGSSPTGVASIGSSATTIAAPPAGMSGSSGEVEAGQLKFANCMHAHGEPDYPEPGGNAEANVKELLKLDPRSPRFREAASACQRYLVKGGAVSPAVQERVEAEALRYARCMQTHGMPSWPDPSGIGYMVAPAGSAASSPNYLRAAKACRSLLPGA
ncbi:MAG TPA: hypothetical protein VMD59_00125 [Acidimicrobiales bacterium]|nr:hypothetical protein [Acidimicrobiales bacterium]